MTKDFLELRKKVITKKSLRQRRLVKVKPFVVLGATPKSATDELLRFSE